MDDDSNVHLAPGIFVGLLIFEMGDAREEARASQLADFEPPPLFKTWQFSYRTALPPRAPSSFAS